MLGACAQPSATSTLTSTLTEAQTNSRILVDGSLADWAEVQPLITDPVGDAPSEYDLKTLYSLKADKQLYLAIQFAIAVPMVPLHIFINDAYFIEAQPGPNGATGVIYTWPANEKLADISAAYGEIVELKVPLEIIGNPTQLKMDSHSKTPDGQKSMDTMSTSIPITTSASTSTSTSAYTPPQITCPVPVETHNGDIVVNSGETLEIKNKTLELEGNLILKPGSKMLMENGALIVSQRYKSEYRILADQADIKLINSGIDTSGDVMVERFGSFIGTELNIVMEGGTTAYIENSIVYGRLGVSQSSRAKILDSTLSYIYWNYDSHLEASNVVISSFVFDGKQTLPETFQFQGLKMDKTFDLVIKSTADGGSLSLQNCNVKNLWSFNFEWGCTKDITIEDSEIENIWIKFPPTDEWISIANLPHGLIPEYDLNEAVSGISLPYGVELKNVELGMFKPEMWSTKATISNSYAMVHPYDAAELVIKDSTLINMNHYGCKKIEFFNDTFIGELQLIYKPEFAGGGFNVDDKVIGPGGYLHWVLHNTVINVTDIVVAMEEGIIEGDLTIVQPKNIANVSWVKGVITRVYPLIARPNATIKLLDSSATIWSGQADENGKASFSITFNTDNYTKTFTVQAENISQEVTFLSDTPLDLR